IDAAQIEKHITTATKVIMPVDIGGMPCDYDFIMQLAQRPEVKSKFNPTGERQQQLGRILVISDAAHSFGASYKGRKVGAQADVMGFSFHAVKNLTTAEGGAITLNLPAPFDNDEVWRSINISALHGQTKDALSKTQAGQWRYDIVEAGFKCNMTDIQAAIGLVELDRYDNDTLVRRKSICTQYTARFSSQPWFSAPLFESQHAESCYHLYMLHVSELNEAQRDEVIRIVAEQGIALNVHFQPLPLLSLYKGLGYRMDEYPNAWKQYSAEISLPVYYNLSDDDAMRVADAVIAAVNSVLAS
ncbi:MAG: DegT/DnrJ/EryC1/StrS family aminotransferase, partial [Flavobacteriales bacterium]